MIFKMKRNEVGISQSDMARRCGVSRQFICMIEAGKCPCPLSIKIEYLKLNPSPKDLIIIDYLQQEKEGV